MKKFTPGPWELNDSLEVIFNGKVICETYLIDEIDENDEGVANAHLIAAAPEMYEALKNSKLVIEYLLMAFGTQIIKSETISTKTDEQLQIINKALAKAEGSDTDAQQTYEAQQ